ncbi:MAG TPA: hypothetical protein PLJ33_06650 [Peptococcaceae bacterium]|jgi:hypothetical protein|nr:hypothetical protein [Clostridia bacterium]HOB82742.1 hypothetical protein [Peptococcaceae bacterium]HPZ71422.1 hypothetical protein [Peptococcaceae bacterium]HQD54515.1 hypothetical protein [Peptococcaceae bacterium]
MKPGKKLFLLVLAELLIVFVGPQLITAFVESVGLNLLLRTMLVLLAIYLALEITVSFRPGNK